MLYERSEYICPFFKKLNLNTEVPVSSNKDSRKHTAKSLKMQKFEKVKINTIVEIVTYIL